MKLIERKDYLKTLINVKNTPDIKVITGVRRSGKSKLLLSFMEWLKKQEQDSHIVYINLQETENEQFLEYHCLHDYILEQYVEGKNNYLFIDEVQLCTHFEKAVNSIHAKEIYDILLKGEYIDYYKGSLVPDESIFQTIYMNSRFKDKYYDKLTYVNWKGQINHPKTFTIEDCDELEKVNYLMARKFDEDFDDKIINKLYDEL